MFYFQLKKIASNGLYERVLPDFHIIIRIDEFLINNTSNHRNKLNILISIASSHALDYPNINFQIKRELEFARHRRQTQ